MKKFYFLLFLVPAFTGFSQPPVKTYAYSIASTPGNIPVDENGNPIRSKEANVTYLLYLSYSKSYHIKPDGIWIKGQGYSVQTSPVDSTPVTITNHDIPSDPVTTTLVPATKNKVMAIQPIAPSAITVKAKWFRDMLKKNDLIISYFYKGKKYFIPVRKIKQLPAVAGV